MESKKIVEAYHWRIHRTDGNECYLSANVMGHQRITDRHRIESSIIQDVELYNEFAVIKTENTEYKCCYCDCRDFKESLPPEYSNLKARALKAIAEREQKELEIVKSLKLKEKEVCVFLSSYRSYYFDRGYAILNNELVPCDYNIHVSEFQDSVSFYSIPYNRECEFSFFPYKLYRLAFYDMRKDLYVYNSGYEKLEVDAPYGKFIINPGEVEKICRENTAAMITESIAAAEDRFSFDEPVMEINVTMI